MSEELDRRVAELVMGQPEPPEGLSYSSVSAFRGSWRPFWVYGVDGARIHWQPLPFSTDLDQATRAVDKCLEESGTSAVLEMEYRKGDDWPYEAYALAVTGHGKGLPEAMTRWCLALKEREGE